MLGEVIGNYRVMALLGEGGMGVVYRAEHVQLGKQVALKVVQPALSADPTMVQRFFTEARAASSIDHPGIVQVHDFGTHTDGRAYLVMALLRGENLEERLDRGALPVTEAITIVAQAAAALAAAHARGIIHRDLKPDNIFLVPNEMIESGTQVVLLDFGIAKLASDLGGAGRTQVGALIGTPAYMSPEQCMGRADLDHRTDLYSLGCILFHALCGRPPFGSEHGTSVMVAAHMLDAPPRPTTFEPAIPSAVEAIVMQLLEKKPEDRFRTANELRDALVRAGARAPLTRPPRADSLASTVLAPVARMVGATVVSVAPSQRRAPTKPTTGGSSSGQVVPRPATSPARRNKRWLLAGGGAAIGVLAATSIVMFTGDDEPPARTAERAAPAELACPLGQVRGEDTARNCCWPDQAWSTTRNQCIGKPTCPPGMVARDETCIADDQPTVRAPIDVPDVTTWDRYPAPPMPDDGEPEKSGPEGELVTDPAFVLASDPVAPSTMMLVRFARPIYSQRASRAWVAISDPGAPPRQYLAWAFVDHGARTARMRAPSAPGRYELRLYNNYPTQTHNVVRIVPFTVSRSDTTDPAVTPSSAWRFTTAPIHTTGSEARLVFPTAMRAARGEQFWVTVVPEGAFDTTWKVYRYVAPGARDVLLPMPRERGTYELRLHANYPTRTTNVVHRLRIRVE